MQLPGPAGVLPLQATGCCNRLCAWVLSATLLLSDCLQELTCSCANAGHVHYAKINLQLDIQLLVSCPQAFISFPAERHYTECHLWKHTSPLHSRICWHWVTTLTYNTTKICVLSHNLSRSFFFFWLGTTTWNVNEFYSYMASYTSTVQHSPSQYWCTLVGPYSVHRCLGKHSGRPYN